MLDTLVEMYSTQITSIYYLIVIVNVFLHIIFAGAVARDGGRLQKMGQKTLLVSPYIWSFAVLVGGVFTAVVYWLMHYSTLTRPTSATISKIST
jgi:hypothetical protein